MKETAKILSGDEQKAKIIPVRPAWIDTQDLLGYFDPINNTYRSTPFLDALIQAGQVPVSDRLHCICLDELNLARIENYGSDLLSRWEYAYQAPDAGVKLDLYSHAIDREICATLDEINKRPLDEWSSEERRIVRRLQPMVERYKHQITIPLNVVLLGTLNADETTYDLSPKVIDRSYVVTLPPARFEAASTEQADDGTQRGVNNSVISTQEFRSKVANCLDGLDIEKYGWKTLVDWNEKYLTKGLGMPIGHRTKQDYTTFCAVAECIGIDDLDDIRDYFVGTKILPRIRFMKEQASTEGNSRESLFEAFLDVLDSRTSGFNRRVLELLRAQLNQAVQTVRYFGAE